MSRPKPKTISTAVSTELGTPHSDDELARCGLFERDPVDELEVTQWIKTRIATGQRAAVEIAVLIAHVRKYYRKDPADWLTWAQREFGYARRLCFQCLTCGNLLAQVRHGALRECDLYVLAELARIPPDQLTTLLDHWDPSKATREEVRRKVALWADKGPAECDQCGKEFEPKDDETSCPACAGAKARKPQAPTASPLERYIDALAGMDEPQCRGVASQIGPGVAFRAAFKLLDVALYHVHEYGDLTPELLASWRKDLDAAVVGFDQVGREMALPAPVHIP